MTQEAKIPTNHVAGVISGEGGVENVKRALASAGFRDVLAIDHVDAKGEGTNPISGLLERLSGHLSDEVAYLEQYRELTESGAIVVAAKVEDKEQEDLARQILEDHGATNIRHFGRFAVSDLTPATNPSAPSDQPR